MLARRLSEFRGMRGEDFRALWDFVVNGDNFAGGDKYATRERETAIKNLLQIIKSAARLREAYAAYQLRTSNIAITIPFSLRESIDIAACMHLPKFGGVKGGISSVIVPKGADLSERNSMQKIILES